MSKLIWKGNAPRHDELANSRIFELKNSDKAVKIHKLFGCGDNLYLSCHALGIECRCLETEDFKKAVRTAQGIIRKELAALQAAFAEFLAGTENDFVRD